MLFFVDRINILVYETSLPACYAVLRKIFQGLFPKNIKFFYTVT